MLKLKVMAENHQKICAGVVLLPCCYCSTHQLTSFHGCNTVKRSINYVDTDSIAYSQEVCCSCADNVRHHSKAVYPASVYRDEDLPLVRAYMQDLLSQTNYYHSEQTNKINNVYEFAERVFLNLDLKTGFWVWADGRAII